ncbi:hypothetical protein [Runella sp.]|uniref:hypothetical protein n=1 Tax=Runella sp. TaxID=1960881 RepID=UPI003017DFC3
MKTTVILALFCCLTIASYAQPKPLHEVISDLVKKNDEYRKEIGDLRIKISAQAREISRLKADNRRLRTENAELKVKIAKLEGSRAELAAAEQRLREIERESLSKDGEIRAKDLEIERLRQDSIRQQKEYDRFMEGLIVVGDNIILPLNIKIGPIKLEDRGGNQVILDMETAELFSRLAQIEKSQRISIKAIIEAPKHDMQRVKNSVKSQLEEQCPNCDIEVEYEKSDSYQFSIILKRIKA